MPDAASALLAANYNSDEEASIQGSAATAAEARDTGSQSADGLPSRFFEVCICSNCIHCWLTCHIKCICQNLASVFPTYRLFLSPVCVRLDQRHGSVIQHIRGPNKDAQNKPCYRSKAGLACPCKGVPSSRFQNCLHCQWTTTVFMKLAWAFAIAVSNLSNVCLCRCTITHCVPTDLHCQL